MNKLLIIGIIMLISVAISIPFEIKRRRRLNRYWSRSCTGKDWKRRFPEVPKQDIRDFLEVFVDGFAFSSKKRLKFNPDDKVMDVYRALYPSPGWPDTLELETFADNLLKKYKIDLSEIIAEDITFGEIFRITRKSGSNKALQATV